eukprot:1544570-Rhodomonas_salina.2
MTEVFKEESLDHHDESVGTGPTGTDQGQLSPDASNTTHSGRGFKGAFLGWDLLVATSIAWGWLFAKSEAVFTYQQTVLCYWVLTFWRERVRAVVSTKTQLVFDSIVGKRALEKVPGSISTNVEPQRGGKNRSN